MKMFAVVLFLSVWAQAQIPLNGLKPASSAQQSIDQFDFRKNLFIDYYAGKALVPPPKPPKENFQNFASTMLARMVKKIDLDSVSANLLQEDFKPWLTGTDFNLQNICKRSGDYDFVLQVLLQIAYLDREANQTLLSPAAREKLLHVLLSETGTEHHDKVSIGSCATVTDTENHILMTEVSRYLTNQLLCEELKNKKQDCKNLDNSTNGFNEWMLNHVAQYLYNDFSEFNSRPYEGYTQIALTNLYTYAFDAKVKTAARIVLDYSAAKFAIGSNGMRRLVPFRRQKWKLNSNRLVDYDNTVYRNLALAGNFNFLKFENNNQDPEFFNDENYHPLMAAISSYRIPKTILDIQIDKNTEYFQTIRHSDAEIFHSSKSFLLSAGGRYRDMPDYMTGENDALPAATSIIPTQGEAELKNLFYILGDQDVKRRNNLCVTKNFACGLNIHIPENIDASCAVVKDNWSFYDMKKCKGYDFYVAVYKKKFTSIIDNRNDNFGLFEVVEATNNFNDFVEKTLSQNTNANLKADQKNTYTTYDGRLINFKMYSYNMDIYPIAAVNKVATNNVVANWSRATGDVMSEVEKGLFTITSKQLNSKIILDMRNPLNPQRQEIDLSAAHQ